MHCLSTLLKTVVFANKIKQIKINLFQKHQLKMPSELLQCYNRGCGQKYESDKNADDSCQHHPGDPFFHDAYKGWSCCNKKCTDFTEFLNIKGCTMSKHSNVKPVEPEKPQQSVPEGDIVVRPPIQTSLKRPPFNTEMTVLTNLFTEDVRQSYKDCIEEGQDETFGFTKVGTSCKNGGCTVTYEGPHTDDSTCTYHPGCPIFHEGMKYWSCCQKKTTDFNAFLSQVGCEVGRHLWYKREDSNIKQCRWDFHQTGTHVIVSIYAKSYCPTTSLVKVNPVRLCANIAFPKNNGAFFELDVELFGIIDVTQCTVNMRQSKIEISMKKAEPLKWTRLGTIMQKNADAKKQMEEITPRVESVNLDDL